MWMNSEDELRLKGSQLVFKEFFKQIAMNVADTGLDDFSFWDFGPGMEIDVASVEKMLQNTENLLKFGCTASYH